MSKIEPILIEDFKANIFQRLFRGSNPKGNKVYIIDSSEYLSEQSFVRDKIMGGFDSYLFLVEDERAEIKGSNNVIIFKSIFEFENVKKYSENKNSLKIKEELRKKLITTFLEKDIEVLIDDKLFDFVLSLLDEQLDQNRIDFSDTHNPVEIKFGINTPCFSIIGYNKVVLYHWESKIVNQLIHKIKKKYNKSFGIECRSYLTNEFRFGSNHNWS